MTSYNKTTKKASSLSLSLSLLANPAHISSKSLRPRPRSSRGFTIVELLIVIVVIGILAAISIVAYNGISRNANNAATITAAKQAVNAINLYIAEHGEYPAATNGNRCLTAGQECLFGGTVIGVSDTLLARLQPYGGVARSVAKTDSTQNLGIIYVYASNRMFNGVNKPLYVTFVLSGANQPCQLPNVATNGGAASESSTTGYSHSGGTATQCIISIDGPAHS